MSQNRVERKNLDLAFFSEDKQTPFSSVKIITYKSNVPLVIYVKNISSYLLNNFKLIMSEKFKLISGDVPKELKPEDGFFLELEVDTSVTSESIFKIECKPHSIFFE